MLRHIFSICAAFTLANITLSPYVWSDETGGVFDDKALESLIAKVRPSLATIKVSGRDGDQIQMGTGFVIDPSGLIATNLHVIGEGRPFTVEMASGRRLEVVSLQASDRSTDLAIVQVDVDDEPLSALKLSDADSPAQGARVLAFGNPLGLRNSVVSGIISAVREVEGQSMIQLAMPVESGNSGGPVVDAGGNVIGIVNMKSAVHDNLGFAIPIRRLATLREKPNPITMQRWVVLGKINEQEWTPLLGASWQQRGGLITARGIGEGFGGRSLCLSREVATEAPMEIAVQVRLDDESGAAGLAFRADGEHRHYGFYPSNGRLRLTCFKGPSVYSWQVLEEVESEHYLPNHWNRLRVRILPDRFQCFVNGHLVIESNDKQLTSGSFGLVKFRNTNPDFKDFQFGKELVPEKLTDVTEKLLAELLDHPATLDSVDNSTLAELGKSGDAVSRELARRAMALEEQANLVRRLAADVQLAPTLQALSELIHADVVTEDAKTGDDDDQLLRAMLMIAKLDDPDIDVDAYLQRIDQMAGEIRDGLARNSNEQTRRDALHRYLFEQNGYHGGRTEYYHVANSHLHRVIDDREGLPITLSILYMELGRRLGLKIEGVGLPGHFIVKHVIGDDVQLVDVFERGKLLSTDDAGQIVAAYARRAITEDDLRGQSKIEILARVLKNLIGIAGRNEDIESIHRYCEALVAIDPNSAESRMMRSQARAMTNRRTGAIEDLDWLIENDPAGFNHNQAVQMRQALIERGMGTKIETTE